MAEWGKWEYISGAPVTQSHEDAERAAKEFAVAVSREVCIRSGQHKAYNADERRWQAEGIVMPAQLDTVRKARWG